MTTQADTQASHELSLLIETLRVERLERLSPSFVRLWLGGPGLADLGCDEATWDQRVKLVFPDGDGPVPSFEGADETWWTTWIEKPVSERGHMRTYTIRDVVGTGADTQVAIDIVLHDDEHGGEAGPGSRWAARADVGSEVAFVGPRRGVEYGGIEFHPADADHLLLVGDETAVPAVARILQDLVDAGSTLPGAVFVEVPVAGDVQDLVVPPDVEVTWVVRGGAPHGARLHAAVVDHLGGGSREVQVSDAEVVEDLWETPEWSSSGEALVPEPAPARAVEGLDLAGCYAWIAGESKLVTGLRRVLVKELGVDRRQVAFMGYWRLGVAMRS